MAKREYFYKDEKGNLQRYYYCSMCSSGPFTNTDEHTKYINVGSQRPVQYCIPCTKNARIRIIDPMAGILRSTQNIGGTVEKTIIPKKPSPVDKNMEFIEQKSTSNEEKLTHKEQTFFSRSVSIKNPHKKSPWCEIIRSEMDGKKEIPTKDSFLTYIAQFSDDSYTCGVTKDLKTEAVNLNTGRKKRVPAEILFYRSAIDEAEAIAIRDYLSKLKRHKKEKLILSFEKQIFGY